MGFASGFQAGSQAVERYLQRKKEEELQKGLAEVYKAPTSALSYTSDQMAEMRRMQGTGSYDIEAVPGAEGQTPTLRYTPKQGLDYGDAGAGLPTDFAPQQVQMYGGRSVAGEFDPNVLRGLQMRGASRVIGASGDALRAAQLEAEAARMDREAVEAPLRLEGLRQQLKLSEQQLATGDLTLAEKKQQAEATTRMNNFNTAFGEANALAASEGRTLTAVDIANLAKANKLSFTQENEVIASQVGRTQAEVNQFRLEIEKVTQGKGFEQLIDLHKNDKRFGDGVHFVSEPDKKTGGYILARVNEATGQVEERLPFKTKAEATAYLREEAVNPANAAIWLQNYRKGETGIEANQAQIRASNSTVSLNAAKAAQTAAQTKILNTNVENNVEARKIQSDLASLDEENDPTGSRRANLIAQFNMLAAGPGKTIPTGGTGGKKGSILQMPVELKKNDDGTYTAYSKDGGMPLYNSYNGEQIPLGMEIDAYKKMKEAAVKNSVGLVTGEENGRLVLKYIGADGKYYDDPQKAKYAKPAPAEKKPAADGEKVGLATSRDSGVKNPFVDATGKALPNAPAGNPSVASGLITSAANSIEANLNTTATATRYLQGKIDRKEPLAPNERARAIQLGLINR